VLATGAVVLVRGAGAGVAGGVRAGGSRVVGGGGGGWCPFSFAFVDEHGDGDGLGAARGQGFALLATTTRLAFALRVDDEGYERRFVDAAATGATLA